MVAKTYRSICRFCHAGCPIFVDVEHGRAVRVRGDRDDPVYRGFTCEKGRQLPEQHHHPQRLLHPMRKRPDGGHERVALDTALDDIAARVSSILERYGPRAIAMYTGTCASRNPAAKPMLNAFMDAIASPMRFDSNTIDQPGKAVAAALHGVWQAPPHGFDAADVTLLIGGNPLVAMSGGIPNPDPVRRLRDARARGMQLLVIDPRRSETAVAADLHLQPVPGEDVAIVASLLHVIVRDELYDAAFAAEYVEGLDALRRAVEPFAPNRVAEKVGLRTDEIVDCARRFARAAGESTRGVATSGTGPSFNGRFSTLFEYLVMCLNTLCGRYLRAGERVWNPGVLLPAVSHTAQVTPPWPAFGYGESLRVRNLRNAACGLSTAALADEILLDGDERVRALIVLGGNPVAAWPDLDKTWRAMHALDLLVTLDIKLSATARAAHYVLAPPLTLEIPGTTYVAESMYHYAVGFGLPVPYANATPPVLAPPAGSELIEEWRVFAELASRIDRPLALYPNFRRAGDQPMIIDASNLPTLDQLLAFLYQHGRVPYAEVVARGQGTVFDNQPVVVRPGDAGHPGRFDVANPEMLADLAAYGAPTPAAAAAPFRLIPRRHVGALNSSGLDLPKMQRLPYNPAYMNPHDMIELSIADGDEIELRSQHGRIAAIAATDAGLRRGLVSMTHAYGEVPGGSRAVHEVGSNVAALTCADEHYDRITGMPQLGNIAVAISRTPRRAP